jgi:clan AA aspartic protease
MVNESGKVNRFREAVIEVKFPGGASIECVVDTGFDGGLMLPRTLAEGLQIQLVGELVFDMVGGARMSAPVGLVKIEWLNEQREIEAILGKGNDVLIGTELLAGTTLTIDYTARVVTIFGQANHPELYS